MMNKILFLLGLILTFILGYFCVYLSGHPEDIQSDITARMQMSFAQNNVDPSAAFRVDGRDIYLTGSVESIADKTNAGQTARAVYGARIVHNDLTVTPKAPAAVIEQTQHEPVLVPMPDMPEMPKNDVVSDLNESMDSARDLAESLPVVIDDAEVDVSVPAVIAETPVIEETTTEKQNRACEEKLAKILEQESIEFDSGSSKISARSAGLLLAISDEIKACPDSVILIGGHTDNVGNAAVNIALSKARAKSVAQYLLGQGAKKSYKIVGYGDQAPRAKNDTPEGRKRNRRIDFKVLNK